MIPDNIIDKSTQTYWESVGVINQSVTIDFLTKREFGGLKIDWLKNHFAKEYEILFSDDGKKWQKV